MFNKTYKKQINNKLITHKRYNKSKKNGVNTNKIIKKSKSKRINLKGGAKGVKGVEDSSALDKILDETYELLKHFTSNNTTDFEKIIEKLVKYNKDNNINILIENIENLNTYLAVCEDANQKHKHVECQNFAKNVKETKLIILHQIKIILLNEINEKCKNISIKNKTEIVNLQSSITLFEKIFKNDLLKAIFTNDTTITKDEITQFIALINNFISAINDYKKNNNTNINTNLKESITYLESQIEPKINIIIPKLISLTNVSASSTKEPSISAKGPIAGPSISAKKPASSAKGPASSAKGPAAGPSISAKRPVRPTTDIQLIPPTIYVSNPVSNTNNIVYNTSLLSPSEIQQIKKLNLHNKTQKEMEFNTTGRKLIPINQTHYTTFTNVGNSCYLNSALQFLFAIPEFIAIIKNQDNNSDVIHTLKTLLDYFESYKGIILNIDDVTERYKELTGLSNTNNMNKDIKADLKKQTIYEQLFIYERGHDADTGEFFLQKIFPYIDKNPIFIKFFGFNATKEITCINNTKFKKNDLTEGEFDKTLQIELYNENDKAEIQQKILEYIDAVNIHKPEEGVLLSLKQAIDDFKTYTLQQYIEEQYKIEYYTENNIGEFDKCKTDINPEGLAESFKIISFNTKKYIIIFIKRFFNIFEYNENREIINQIRFKIQFRVEPNPLIYIDISTNQKRYKLKSCIIHVGNSFGHGHYVYLNFDDKGNPLHIIDDSVVYPYDGLTNEYNNYIRNGYFYLYEQI